MALLSMPNEVSEAVRQRIANWQALFMLPRSIWVPIIALGLVGLAAVLFNEQSIKTVSQGNNLLTSVLEIKQNLVDLRATLTDAENGQRGYLLSGDARYLEPYERALASLPVLAAKMRANAAGDPQLLVQMTRLDSLRGRKIAELRATVMLAQQGHREDALLLMRADEGRQIMSAFVQQAKLMQTELDAQQANIRMVAARDVQLPRLAIATLGVVTLALLTLAVRLLVKDFRRLDAERESQRQLRQQLEQQVGERTGQLSRLTTHLQSVTELEKAELARNLHDELGGVLTAAKMDLAWLQGRTGDRGSDLRDKLSALGSCLDEAMDVKRRVVENLRPALLDHFGLPTALQSYFDETCKKAGLNCKSVIPPEFEQVPQDMAIALFRVGQEALTNVIRHARATNVEMTFSVDAEHYRIHIADDGVGVNPAKLSGAMSHGLAGMRHRIETLKGEINIGANRAHGTRVDIIVPKPLEA